MTQLYAGNPASYPTNITLPSDDSSDAPQAPLFNTAFEGLADRTAYIAANYASLAIGGVFTGGVTFDTSVLFEGPAGFSGSGFLQTSAPGQIIAAYADSISSQTGSGIRADAAFGIDSSVVAGIVSGVDQGIALTGSAAGDWIRYNTLRSQTRLQSLQPAVGNADWTPQISPAGSVRGSATASALVINLDELLDGSYSGATLASVRFRFIIVGPHAAVPNPLPTFNVVRASYTVGGAAASVSLSTVGPQSPAVPGSGAAWDDTGKIQEFVFTCNQLNVIDKTQYHYYAVIVDENTTNQVAGNYYLPLVMLVGDIANSGLC
jgi:hypothetical protein